MNILDNLIRIKNCKQEDDLLKILDEIPVYEKLSVDENLKDLTKSEITRMKCPLLAGFVDGNLYETLLADLAANVYLEIEGAIPPVLMPVLDQSKKRKKQMEVLQSGIVHVSYRELLTYDHEEMKDQVSAVFTKPNENGTTMAIIIKKADEYVMFHGTYAVNETNNEIYYNPEPQILKTEQGVFSMDSYSVLGNNGYPFGRYTNKGTSYSVMIGPDSVLYLLNGSETKEYQISGEEKNHLNIVKKDPKKFAEAVTEIVERVVGT